jgi:ribosomal protein S18 acetylase RimI-like enzyme
MHDPGVLQQFTIPLAVTVRICVRDDLPNLEWFGLFTAHREVILSAYERQERGENLMLVAEANRFPVGQVWIDLAKKSAESVGVLWAVRVIPCLQNLGIGTRLMGSAEWLLRGWGFAYAELGVEKDNLGARRLYERLGYSVVGTEYEEYCYTTPDGTSMHVPVDEWILRKDLGRDGAGL